jgi:SAM-dependent methyltransferase
MLYKDAITELQANEHELVEVEHFHSTEEYVLYLMHLSDYMRARQLVSNRDVLDLGCNNGYGTNILGGRCKRIVGVDVSSTAIAAATSKYQSDNVSFRQIDGRVLPFSDDSFDVITSFQVIEHLSDYQAYFSEIRRVLRPAGTLLLTTPNACIRVLPGARPWNRFHIREFRPDELLQLVRSQFEFGQVVGQFAEEGTYAIEYDRCIRARDSGSRKSEKSLRELVSPLLPQAIKHLIQRALSAAHADKQEFPSDDFKKAHNIEDFFYSERRLEESLSLVALCANNRAAQLESQQVFLSNVRQFHGLDG